MGAEGILLLTNSLQFSDRAPPSSVGYGDYQPFRENFILAYAMTSIPVGQREPTIIGQLPVETNTSYRQNDTAGKIDI